MTYRGHIKNGKIALDEPIGLPEGARITVAVAVEPTIDRDQRAAARERKRRYRPIQMPGGSLADQIIRDRR